MAILVTCNGCGANFQAKDADAGKKGRCPNCRGEIQVPGRPPAASPAKTASPASAAASPAAAPPGTSRPLVARPVAAVARQEAVAGPARVVAVARSAAPPQARLAARQPATPQELLAAFQGYVEPARVHFGYRLGVALVVLVMALLPLCYLGLIFAVFGVLCLHAVFSTGVVTHAPGGRATSAAILIYLAPLAAGAILVFFMIKPFFARPAKRQSPRSLDRRSEPLLFAFVERVCDVVGAPYPTRIDVDCQVNASAGFRRGVWSMFSDDLVLTIGLPLAAGLNLRQFSGVLAHEFGHFSQGTAMRLSYLIRAISFWFTRVVYERDAWDEQLIVLSRELDIRLGFIVYLARGCIWLTRKALWLFMMLGHLVSGYLLRQMEFDADRYEAQVAGSETFAETARQLALLSVATQGAYADLDEYRREGRLGDDLPKLIVANVSQIPDPLLAVIDAQIAERKAGLFDTHPSDRDRIEAARRLRAPGLFHVESPATVLFSNFAALSKTATFDFYRLVFGKRFKLGDMHPVDQLLARQEKTKADVKSLARYFQGAFNMLRPIRLPGILPGEAADPRQTLAQLKQAREQMLSAVPAYRAAFAAYDKADTQKLESGQADAVLTARLSVKPDEFSQPMDNPRTVLQLRQGANYRLGQLAPQLEPLERWAEHRLLSALVLLQAPKVAARISSAQERLEEVQRILAAYSFAAAQIEPSLELRNQFAVFMALASRLEGQRENATLMGMLEKNMSLLIGAVRDMQRELSMARYPFGHATAEPSLAEFIIPEEFQDADWNGVLNAAGELLEGVPRLYARMLGRLVVLAEEVEAAFGLPQLPEPPPPKEPRPTA